VGTGDEVDVTITAMNYGVFGAVVETLPAGFTYVTSTLDDVEEQGRNLTFALIGENESFTYTVAASSVAGSHTFSGELTDDQGMSYPVGGATGVTVEAAPDTGDPSATRSFSETSVGTGDEVVVTITAMNYGVLGAVVETLPAGFSYVSSTLDDVEEQGRNLTFALIGENESFTYTVAASSVAGSHTFSGELTDDQGMSYPVGGATGVTVEAAPDTGDPSATRSFSETSVGTGDEVVVTITAMNYGVLGAVVETLPGGFSYVSSTLDDVEEQGRNLTFALIGENESFTYTVAASSVAGSHTFSGQLIDDQGMTHTVGGASSVTVGARATPAPTVAPTPAPTRISRPSRRSGGGGGGGGGIAALPAGTVAAGATVSSPAPSETVPAQARVRTPNAGVVRITIAPEQVTPLLQGFNAAGTVFDITAPRASAEEPLVLTFLVRTQTAAGDLIVLKDGVAAADCRGASGQASPDPCVSSRGKAGTTVVVKVLTSEDGIWEFRSSTLAAAPTPAPTVVAPTPKPTVAPTMRPTPEPTVAPTPEPTVAPTMRPTPTPTAAVVLPRPRPTATPTAVPTAVPPAPTAASTPAPTATPTTAPMAVTVAPEPTPTAMPEPTVTTAPVAPPAVEEDEGFPLWLIVVIIVGVGAVLVGGGFIILRARGG
jgi:hypothetical protein